MFFYDFKQGIKQNSGSFALAAIVISLASFLMQLLIRYGYFVADSPLYDAALVLAIALFVLLALISIIDIFQTDLYNLPLFQRWKNSFLLSMRTAPKTLVALLAFAAPWAMLLIPYDGLWYFIVLAFLFIVILPLGILAIQEYSFAIFDRYINKDHHPSIYDKGIYRSCRK